MKLHPLAFVVVLATHLVSCGGSDSSIDSDFNPLGQPGGKSLPKNPTIMPVQFSTGSYVVISVNSAPFFRNRPSDGSTAESLLPAGTMMRVVKSDSSFVKVELDDGKVGYVACAMVRQSESSGASSAVTGVTPPTIPAIPPSAVNAELGNPTALPPSTLESPSALSIIDPASGVPMPPITPPSIPPLPASGEGLPPSSVIPNSAAGDALPPSSVDRARRSR